MNEQDLVCAETITNMQTLFLCISQLSNSGRKRPNVQEQGLGSAEIAKKGSQIIQPACKKNRRIPGTI
jgi:hypothetical protein